MKRTPIGAPEFRRALQLARCPTLSQHWKPNQGESAWVASTTVGEFLDLPTFPVWYVDEADHGGVEWNSQQARPLPFREAVRRDDFQTAYGRSWPSPPAPQLIVLECSRCGHIAIIDGTHRLTKFAAEGAQDLPLTVWGLSGTEWPPETPDMNVICACRRQAAAG